MTKGDCMSEILKYEGHLGELHRAKKKREIDMEGLVKSLRDNLDVLERPENLKTDIIANQAIELRVKRDQYQTIIQDMEKIFSMYPHLRGQYE